MLFIHDFGLVWEGRHNHPALVHVPKLGLVLDSNPPATIPSSKVWVRMAYQLGLLTTFQSRDDPPSIPHNPWCFLRLYLGSRWPTKGLIVWHGAW